MDSTLFGQKKSTHFFKKPIQNGGPMLKVIPWVEKYRPKSINDITSQEEVVLFFKNVLETSDLPNMLFYGPPGTGKTSSILALARDLFGPDQLKNRVLELNASDERGIQVIRDKVKTFAQLAVGHFTHKITNKPLPPYKLIILDESDNMTSSAQAALRRIMESSLSTTRFCLICNYFTKIIDPIHSRCSCFYFKPLPPLDCLSRLKYIRDKESLALSDENLEFLIQYSNGDLRKAIMHIQCCRYLTTGSISRKNLLEICGIVSDDFSVKIFGLFENANYDRIVDTAKDFISEGFSVSKFLIQLQEYVMTSDGFNDTQKADIFLKLSDLDKNLTDGADELLQLLSILSFVHELIKN